MPVSHEISRMHGYIPRAAIDAGLGLLAGATGAGLQLDRRFGINPRFLLLGALAGGVLSARGVLARLPCWFERR
jgi:hypothetical protein